MVEINKEITFMDTSTNTPITYDWNFGDGTVLTGITENPVKHKYSEIGDYTITHKVTNECGPSNICTKTITITSAQPSGGTSPTMIAAAALGLIMILKKK